MRTPLIVATLLLTTTCQAADPFTLTGTYQGGGHACYGQLRIHKHSLSWQTPFSTCKKTRFSMTDLGRDQSAQRSLFRLEQRPFGCPYKSVVLAQRFLDGGQTQWEVTGYTNEEDQKANRLANALSCPLIRLK